MVILKGNGIVLRPYRSGDEASLQENINNKDIYKYTSVIPYPYTLKMAREWVKECQGRERQKKKTSVNFAITLGDMVIGGIGLGKIEGHKAVLGYWLGRRYWGKGIMTGSVRLVTKYAFTKLRLKRISAQVFLGNKASRRVLQKNRFSYEGYLRKYVQKEGKLLDAWMYAKIR